MSTTSYNYSEYDHVKSVEKITKTKGSAERNTNNQSEKWSSDRLKNELSSLIAEFSYVTDVPVKPSKDNKPRVASPSYQVYVTDTTRSGKDPFRGPSPSKNRGIRKIKTRPSKSVEWKDDIKNRSYDRPSLEYTKDSIIITPPPKTLSSRTHLYKKDKKSKSKRKIIGAKNDSSPKRSSHRKRRSHRSRPSSSNRLKKGSRKSRSRPKKSRSRSRPRKSRSRPRKSRSRPRKSRSRLRKSRSRSIKIPRHKKSQSQPEGEIVVRKVKKRPVLLSHDPPEKICGTRKKCVPESEVEIIEKRSIPHRVRKLRSRTRSSIKYMPLRYEGENSRKVIVRRRCSTVAIKKIEKKDYIPSEAPPSVTTIYPRLQEKKPESSQDPEFLNDPTLPCKCFQCMRKYKSVSKLSNQYHPVKDSYPTQPTKMKVECFCRAKRDYPDAPQPRGNVFIKKQVPIDPMREMAFDYCGRNIPEYPREEEARRWYEKVPYPCYGNSLSESTSGYITAQSGSSVYFKFNCYAHRIDSTITRYFHSILADTTFAT